MKKSCSNCEHFIKIKSLSGDSGICQYYDSRTKADYDKSCTKHKSKKYNRTLDKQK